MSIYLVKLLKRLLDFKSFLLFLIKCTAERNTGSLKIVAHSQNKSRLLNPLGLRRPGHPLRHERPTRPSIKPQLSLSYQPLQAKDERSLGQRSRLLTPPPSLILHPASKIILDIDEVLGDQDVDVARHSNPDESAFIPER